VGRSPSGRVVECNDVRGKMNLNSFMMKAFIPTDGMRKGQKFFNFLHEVRPDLANGLVEKGIDPFYKDDLLDSAVQFVYDNW